MDLFRHLTIGILGVVQCVQVGSKVDVSAAVPANKRKTPHVAAASVVSAATGSKKQKPDLTCTVCNITAASEVYIYRMVKASYYLQIKPT